MGEEQRGMGFIPLSEHERRDMLARIGIADSRELFDVIPEAVRFPAMDLPPRLTEMEALAHLRDLASQNCNVTDMACFVGAGVYNHYVPSAVDQILMRGEFYTAYTPYQPELSQGTLQYMFEFQSLVCTLTGMDVANSSVYDGSTATAEAVLMSQRLTGRVRVVLSGALHPEYREVLETYLEGRGLRPAVAEVRPTDAELEVQPAEELVDEATACVVLQQPDFFGHVRDLSGVADRCHAVGALLVIVVAEAASFGLLKSPGEWGADIAVAEGQSLGMAMALGGPYAGLMATRQQYLRQLPGRIVGQTVDAQDRRGFVLTLQAREQHIRREKATSNICTSQTLLSLAATVYTSLMGPGGLRSVAQQSHDKAVYLADRLSQVAGYRVATPRPFFNEFALLGPGNGRDLRERLIDDGFLAGYPLGDTFPDMQNGLLLACTELSRRADIDRLADALERSGRAA
jgi:glycine dehydrogenase subunit 1